jgi:hypothetical protein
MISFLTPQIAQLALGSCANVPITGSLLIPDERLSGGHCQGVRCGPVAIHLSVVIRIESSHRRDVGYQTPICRRSWRIMEWAGLP